MRLKLAINNPESWQIVRTYYTSIEAQLDKSILMGHGINCVIRDEQTASIIPVLTHAIGGIKLLVAAKELQSARDLLDIKNHALSGNDSCPNCQSSNIETRKIAKWTWVMSFLLLIPLLTPRSKYRCLDCGQAWS
jgi:hypothetical protein